MRKYFLFLVLIIATHFGFSQGSKGLSFSVQVNDCQKSVDNVVSGEKDLVADFSADKVYGAAPLTVQFMDRSQGLAVKWLWRFGDGITDTVQEPLHTYQQEGIYTVKLTVWDADSSLNAISKPDFIRAVGYGICDTLYYDIPGSYYLYRVPEPATGYLSGNNSRGDLAKASHFSVSEDKGLLMGGLFDFAWATKSLANDVSVIFRVWDNDGPGNSPGTLLDTSFVLISKIKFDVQYGLTTAVFFDKWVPIDNDFYMGVELPQVPGDTVAVFTNKNTNVENGNGWEQIASGEWRTYNDGNEGLDVDNAIYPIICQVTGIENHILEQNMLIYPVPATDRIYISIFDKSIKDLKVSILDVAGRMVVDEICNFSSGSSIDVSHLSEGMYIIRLYTADGVFNKKIMIK